MTPDEMAETLELIRDDLGRGDEGRAVALARIEAALDALLVEEIVAEESHGF